MGDHLPEHGFESAGELLVAFVSGFELAIALSFQFEIRPRKIPASTSGVNFTSPLTPGML